MNTTTLLTRRHAERGFALVTVLLLLLVLTLAALASTRMSTLEERMAGNLKDRQLALNSAEAALRNAEAAIKNDAGGMFKAFDEGRFTAECTNGWCDSTGSVQRWQQLTEADWAATGTKTFAYGSHVPAAAIAGVSSQPRYAIEFVRYLTDPTSASACWLLLRLTTRATGGDPNARVVLQSTYRHKADSCVDAI
jgi:type IV pilus assembly protein PilX